MKLLTSSFVFFSLSRAHRRASALHAPDYHHILWCVFLYSRRHAVQRSPDARPKAFFGGPQKCSTPFDRNAKNADIVFDAMLMLPKYVPKLRLTPAQ